MNLPREYTNVKTFEKKNSYCNATIYVHVPFCEKKCIYCDFYSIETLDLIDEFTDAIVTEIKHRSHLIDKSKLITSIFFGGGTPSLLTPLQFEKITNELHRSFSISSDLEFTVECNPGTVDEEKLRDYKSLGVNRLSFGVQSFHEDDLKFLSRIHTVEQAVDSINIAHQVGFENISLDLMFSLPHQTPERWLYNLTRARELGTKHISCYSLTIEDGTPLAVMVKNKTVDIASEENDATLYELTMSTLEDWGYHQYEVSNYARTGFECKHNLSYWRHEEYFGFGPSAHSYWNNSRMWNASSIKKYLDDIKMQQHAIVGQEELTKDKLRYEYIFLRLRSEGIDLHEFQSRFGSDFIQENNPAIKHFHDAGLMVSMNGIIRLTKKGFLVCDEICSQVK